MVFNFHILEKNVCEFDARPSKFKRLPKFLILSNIFFEKLDLQLVDLSCRRISQVYTQRSLLAEQVMVLKNFDITSQIKQSERKKSFATGQLDLWVTLKNGQWKLTVILNGTKASVLNGRFLSERRKAKIFNKMVSPFTSKCQVFQTILNARGLKI